MEQHVKILGILHLVFSAIGILVAVLIFFGAVGGGLLSGDAAGALIASSVGLVVALIVLVFVLPGLIAGYGLLKYKSWARILAIVLGALNILNFPFGTALGAYTIWALTRPEVQRAFEGRASGYR